MSVLYSLLPEAAHPYFAKVRSKARQLVASRTFRAIQESAVAFHSRLNTSTIENNSCTSSTHEGMLLVFYVSCFSILPLKPTTFDS